MLASLAITFCMKLSIFARFCVSVVIPTKAGTDCRIYFVVLRKTVPIMPSAPTNPGPDKILPIPFNIPFAKSLPAPSPSSKSLNFSIADIKGANNVLAAGSKILFPKFSCNFVNSNAA